MSLLDKYVNFIFLIKILFLILAILNLYLKKKIPREEKDKNKDKQKSEEIKKQIATQQKIEYWRTRIELLFKFLMALLLIYIFNPSQNRTYLIDYETRLLFFLFGFILIFTADWKQIFDESEALIELQNIFKP
jgi:prepilin signal peptidase PulO-like enzyme (type II secretory pathway)